MAEHTPAPRKNTTECPGCGQRGIDLSATRPQQERKALQSIRPSDLTSPLLATKTERSAGPARVFQDHRDRRTQDFQT